jgi:isopenicillin N synthase-like dioxygenase
MSRSSEVPPFPENLLAVPLKVISYAKLLAADQNEEKKLFQASKELGFFYLDLQNASEREETLLSDVDHLFTIAPQLFAIPQEEKEKYDLTKNNAHG